MINKINKIIKNDGRILNEQKNIGWVTYNVFIDRGSQTGNGQNNSKQKWQRIG